MLFHAGWRIFRGGYVGVDVFFVISGYLITSLILKELAAGTFSFVGFWVRRARRILPALTVVVLFTLVVGWYVLFPTDYKDLGRTVLTQAFFSSNLYLWLTTGYFAAPSATKPLLHTWSLSVEEQFYLVIPFTLFVLTRYATRFAAGIVFVLLAASFIASAWSSYAYPSAAFYLPHSRAWELLVGSVVAMFILRRPAKPSHTRWKEELTSAMGVGAVLGTAILYDKNIPFPGLAALVPCLGTAAIIHSNTERLTFTGRVLAHRSLVGIGLISYSLYLWHWPLLAFARYLSIAELSVGAATAIVLGSAALAWISYRYVETPIRRGSVFKRRPLLLSAAATVLLAMFVAGTYMNVSNGVRWRNGLDLGSFELDLHPADRRWRSCQRITSVAMPSRLICRLGGVSNARGKVLLVGDSFAEMYLPPLEFLSRQYQQEVWYVRKQNVPVQPEIMEVVAKYAISQVVLSYSWDKANKNGIPELYPPRGQTLGWIGSLWSVGGYDPVLVVGDTKAAFRRNLEQLVRALRARNIAVSIIDSPPYYSVPIPLKLSMLVKRGGDPANYGSPLSKHLLEQSYIYEVFRELRANDVQIVKVTDALCDPSGFCRTYLNGHSLYADEIHLSEYGAGLTTPLLEPIFSRAKQPSPASALPELTQDIAR